MMKKFSCIFIIFSLVTVITACGQGSTPAPVAEQSSMEAEVTPVTEEAASEVVATEEAEPEPSPEEIIEAAMNEGLDYYYARNGKTADNEKALEAFQKAADLESADAYYYIGRLHDRAEEYSDAKSAYEKAIDLGNSMAKLGLGELYILGNGVDIDNNKGKELFESSISEGCNEANAGIGDLYQNGYDGLEADLNKAIECFEITANGNEPEWVKYASESLAFIYSGVYDSVPQDMDKVNQYIDSAIEVSKDWTTSSYVWAGQFCFDYLNDTDKALNYWEAAAALNDAEAMARIGYTYVYNKKDIPQGIEWYEKAADQNNALALNNLGYMYEKGEGVDVDYAKALDYYESAVDAGDIEAFGNIGRMYRDGNGVDVDYAKAVECFEKAVDAGSDSAATNLAVMYIEGQGVDKDYEKAADYFARAVAHNNQDAKDSLANMVGEGLITQDKANELLSKYPAQ